MADNIPLAGRRVREATRSPRSTRGLTKQGFVSRAAATESWVGRNPGNGRCYWGSYRGSAGHRGGEPSEGTITGCLSVRWRWRCVATWLFHEAGDRRVRAISNSTPLTADGRVEPGVRARRRERGHGGRLHHGRSTAMTISVPTRQCGHRGRSAGPDARGGSGVGGAVISDRGRPCRECGAASGHCRYRQSGSARLRATADRPRRSSSDTRGRRGSAPGRAPAAPRRG